ncbi:MAG: CoA transferase [Thermodesulfobacteriota bacterium]
MSGEPGPDQYSGPLEGVRVLEYGVFHAGPGACAILGDLGADVIKIETPDGDPERHWTTVGGLTMALPDGQSYMHEVSNRNKRGICLDIKKEKGRDLLHRLVRDADVFLTNLRKSTKKKLGLDYQTLSRINPKLIHANVSGYGPEGPLSDLGAFDPLGSARSGLMYLTGSQEPRIIHLGVLDQATAIAASHAVITALFVRERKGLGQEVHISLLSTGLWLTYCNLMLDAYGVDPTSVGDRYRHSPLRNAFCCRDGQWILGTHHPEDKYWPTFCRAVGQEQLLDDPRFADDQARTAHCPELVAIFDQVFARKTRDEWMRIFLAHRLMFSPIQKLPEIPRDPQVLANDYMVPFAHPRLGTMTIPGYPVHFSAQKAGTRRAAPRLGEHTGEVLREIGCSTAEIEDLKKQGVIR